MLRVPSAHACGRMRATVRVSGDPGRRDATRSAAPLLVLALCACGVQVEPKIPRTDSPLSTSGYVGGVFAKDTYVGFGFRLQNEQSNETYVLEVDDEAVSLVAVRPGRYHVKSWLTWALLGRDVIMEQAIAESEPIRRSFQIQAGQVILLGEWHAHFERDMRHRTFTLSSVPITEPGAIRMLQEAYPRFADLTVACLHCIP